MGAGAEPERRDDDPQQALAAVLARLMDTPRDRDLHQRARALVRELGRTVGSAAAVRALLDRHPTRPDVVQLFCLHARTRNDRTALDEGLTAALAAAPQHEALRLQCAQEWHRAKRHEAARQALEPLLATRPDDPAVLLTAADIASALKNYAAVATYLPKAFDLDATASADAPRRIKLATALKHLDQIEAAEAALAPILAAPDAPAAAHEQAGYLARLRGDGPAMLRHFEAAVLAEPASVRLRMLLARALRDAGFGQDAEALVDAILADKPDATEAYLQRGEFALAAWDLARARAAFEQACRSAPSNPRPWQRLAHAVQLTGNVNAALRVLEEGRARTAGPDLALAQSDLLFRRGLDAAAETALRGAEQDFASHAAVRLMRIRRQIASGVHASARDAILALPAGTAEERAARHALIGELAEANWAFAAAAQAYADAAAADPRASAAQEGLGRCALLGFDPEQAREHFAAARELGRTAILAKGGSLNPSQSRYGALLNDAWCDDEALAATRQASAARDVGARLEPVRQFPSYTLAALALLVGLRRAGRLTPRPVAALGPAARRIPRRIHQYWDAPRVPADVAELMRSWSALNPRWAYRRYQQRDAYFYLRRHCTADVVEAFARARLPAQQADLFRLAVLLREGGVWADADDRCLAALEPLTAQATLVLRQEHLGSLANNFIAVAPGHPIIAVALGLATTAISRGDSDSIWLATGPGLMSRVVATYVATDPARLAQLGSDILVLTNWQMRLFTAAACQAGYKATPRSWLNQEFNMAGTAAPDARAQDHAEPGRAS